MAFTLPTLPYAFNALEPIIDAHTMEIHHDKHHGTYVNNLNAALETYPDLLNKSLEELLKSISTLPADIKNAVRNNGGGHWNHSFFWELLSPEKQSIDNAPKLKELLAKQFGSFESFQAEFEKAGLSRFGSGWVWLIKAEDGSVKITSTSNQDNPLMDVAEVCGVPLLGIDVWEHAYYLKHQNRRADYLKGLWCAINWSKLEQNL